MTLLENIQFRLRQALAPAALLALMAYFAYHAVSGHNGLLALRDLEREHAAILVKAEATAAERARLQARVANLRRDNLDPDLLDERARAMLGFTARDELVIYLQETP